MKLNISSLLFLIIFTNISCTEQRKFIGIFNKLDKKIDGIKFGNWGSRPYEYAWVDSLFSIEGKKVIDLGVGLPSQYDWFKYVVSNLNPSFYAGIDFDGRIKNELISESNYEIKYMNMANLEYPNQSFDIAYCISTFEHLPYDTFIKSIQEAHRVLKDEGLLIITLDEEWDTKQPYNNHNGWNTLELSLLDQKTFHRKQRSFGLPEFMELIKDYFKLYNDDAIIDNENGIIYSCKDNSIYYQRSDREVNILNSGEVINSCVSYAVLIKK